MSAPQTGSPTVNSRWRVDIDRDRVDYAGDWIQLRGIKTLDPKLDPSVKDASDYDATGWGQDAVTSRKWGLSGTVLRKRYGTPLTFDEAQQLLVDVANSDNFNELVHVRFYERIDGGAAYEGYALVKWSDKGGPQDDLGEADFELMGQGPRTPIANPFAAGAVAPVVASLSPTSGDTAGGNTVTVNGAGFVGVTDVSIGATPVAFTILSSGQLQFVAPPAAAGVEQVTVTTAAGTSATGAGSAYTYA